MARLFRLLAMVALLGLMFAPTATAADGSPLWVLHVQNHDGGISNGVRARLAATEVDTTAGTSATADALPAPGDLDNVQANADCDPPLPQNETAGAFKPGKPAKAAA